MAASSNASRELPTEFADRVGKLSLYDTRGVGGTEVSDARSTSVQLAEQKTRAATKHQPPENVSEWKVVNDYSLYELLDDSEHQIRLVTISPGLFDDPIQCTLTRYASPWNNIHFEALSYCWGSLTDTSSITLRHSYTDQTGDGQGVSHEEQPFNITKGLEVALRYLRHEDEPRIMWIDALSINQGSIRERNYAIPFMVDVYAFAKNVIIFLGDKEVSKEARSIWDLMDRIQRTLDTQQMQPLWQQEDIDGTLDTIKLTSQTEDGTEFDVLLLLPFVFQDFFAFPWFKRVWVVQEALNAKSATVCCGRRQRDWNEIMAMYLWAVKLSRSYTSGFAGASDARDRLPPFLWSNLFKSMHRNKEVPRLPLIDVIAKGRAFSATDPRDKVFALLSFGEESHNIVSLPPALKPDYGKSSSDVWRDLTRHWIVEHKSLDILAIVKEQIDKQNQVANKVVMLHAANDPALKESQSSYLIEPPPEGHPSWALWHAEHPQSAEKALFRLGKEKLKAAFVLDTGLLDPPNDPSSMAIEGIFVDFIEQVHWTFKRWKFSDHDMRLVSPDEPGKPARYIQDAVPMVWSMLIGAVPMPEDLETAPAGSRTVSIGPYGNGTSLLQAYLETLICRHLTENYFRPGAAMEFDPETRKTLGQDQEANLQILSDFAAHWADATKSGEAKTGDQGKGLKNIPEIWSQYLVPLIQYGDSKRYIEMCEYAEGRCMVRLEKGAIGLCAQGARKGDFIAALAGSSTPVVLRPVNVQAGKAESFDFVGECYLHEVDIRTTTQKVIEKGEGTQIFNLS